MIEWDFPDWFVTRQGHGDSAFGPHILLCDSIGANLEDLLAAWCSVAADAQGAVAFVGDDKRDPARVADMISTTFQSRRTDAVIGHFSSPVAIRAAKSYAMLGVPFFAPGSSADDLNHAGEAPVFQIFGRDRGQIEALTALIPDKAMVLIIGQTGNAGATLMQAMKHRLGKDRVTTCFGSSEELSNVTIKNCIVAVLGSKEFVADVLNRISPSPVALLLSDDSLGSPEVEAAANQHSCPAHIATLVRKPDEINIGDLDVPKLEAWAAHYLGRVPGPYFLTSCLAIDLAVRAWHAGHRRPCEVRTYLAKKIYHTPFGPLTVSASGSFDGFTWETRRIS